MDRLPPGVDPSTVPLMRPPPGEHTNFVDPPSLAWAPLVSVYGSLPLMIIAVGLRMFVRLRHKQIGIDDCTSRCFAFELLDRCANRLQDVLACCTVGPTRPLLPR